MDALWQVNTKPPKLSNFTLMVDGDGVDYNIQKGVYFNEVCKGINNCVCRIHASPGAATPWWKRNANFCQE